MEENCESCPEPEVNAFMQKYARALTAGFVSYISTEPYSFLLGPHCEYGPCEASNPCGNGAVCREEMDLEMFPLGYRCQGGKGPAGPRREVSVSASGASPACAGLAVTVSALSHGACWSRGTARDATVIRG